MAEDGLQAEIMRNMTEGVVLVRTSDWEIVYANEAFEQMFGYEPGELVGQSVDVLNAPSERDPVETAAEIQADLAARGAWSGEVHNARKDGTTFWCKANISNFTHSEHGELSVAVHTDITEKMAAQEELRRSEARLQEAQSVAHIGSWEWDIASDSITWSDELCRIFGVPEGTCPESYEDYLVCIHPDDRQLVNDVVQGAYGSLKPYRFRHRIRWSDGTVRTVDSRGQVVAGEDGTPARMLGTAQDVTDLTDTEAARHEAEERFRRAFEDSAIGMALLSVEPETAGRVLDANEAICSITGYDRETLLGAAFETLIHPDDVASHAESVRALTARELTNVQAEYRIVSGSGDDHWVNLSTSLVQGADGEVVHRLVQLQDVSERKRFEGQLRYLADHDSLTGLFNRRRFAQELERELATARRYETGGALLVIDLDNFKDTNDSAGHAAGDELIRAVARTLKASIRETDYLARLGGDEFAILLPHSSAEEASQVAAGLLEKIRNEVSLLTDRGARRTSASIGVSAFGDLSQRASAEELLIEADIAMYEAKENGRDRFALFEASSGRQEAIEQRLKWSNRIRQALEEDRFVLHAQPIVPFGEANGGMPRYELLLRMVGDDGDLIPPATFLFVAERFGLIEEIDRWVVRRAISVVADRNGAGQPMAVSVNLSAKSIENAAMTDLIGTEIGAAGVDPGCFTFEVTETAAIERVEGAKTFARELKSLGCNLAIDDFGSGFATFYYLKHLAFDYVKIDGEFVKNLPSSRTDQLVVRSLVDIAKGLGKETIAEFVGDDETVAMLREYGVDWGQGFHLGRPGPLDEIEMPVVSTA